MTTSDSDARVKLHIMIYVKYGISETQATRYNNLIGS